MEDLKIKHAQLLEEKRKYHELLFGKEIIVDEEDHKIAKEENPELYKAYFDAKAAIHRFENRLMAMPSLFDKLEYWMVDIVGKADEEDNAEIIIEDFLKSGDMHKAVKESDNLCALVWEYVTEHGFEITDCGGGCSSWHIGVPCNEPESRRLIKLVHKDFKAFLAEDVLSIERMFWGVKWPDLRNMFDARRILGK